MTSTIKVNNIQNQCGANIINESSNTITIGASGDTIALASGASQSGFGRTGTVDWETTIKTGDFTATSGDGYFVNTTSGAITMTLPASPSAGDIVSVKDYAYKFGTNALTVNRNGSNIGGGSDANPIYSTDGAFLTFIFADATKGWLLTDESNNTSTGANTFITATGGTITTCGDFKIHTFTGPGTFCVSAAAGPVAVAEYLVVAGGGGGGGNVGGGGGAGGFRFATPTLAPLTFPAKPLNGPTAIPVSVQGYPIEVGSGGAGGPGTTLGSPGSNSSFSTITSTGGGGGASSGPNPTSGPNAQNPTPEQGYAEGRPGGSGGGTRGTYLSPGSSGPNNHYNNPGGVNVISNGNTPPVSPSQGNRGGAGYDSISCNSQSGGGGGAMAVGNDARGPGNGSSIGGPGGTGGGLPTGFGSNGDPSGSFRYYAGGGAGASDPTPSANATGGLGGGGRGGIPCTASTAGTTNTGGGGGGNGPPASGSNGGSGIVVIRYKFQ